ncbi:MULTISPECIES: GNAT family N-acetyltransferase [unclassified Bacillus (in: firmicutes)]|uniref:GNAT family N-acetyltransferase n=1 Tax=unclassified Bacillus (in: firmicutes) TaxID=185979 RepID=UPI00288A029C|nr:MULTISPECIES: GNAT family N-acetyltransferase [unclassified Bacillus (in: firmicutes)]
MTASGLGVLEDEYIGLYNIITHDNFRNQGNGAILIRNLLHWGKENGAKKSLTSGDRNECTCFKLVREIRI